MGGIVLYDILESLLQQISRYSVLVFEFFGAGYIIFSGLRFAVHLIKRNPKANSIMLQGFSCGLSIMLGAEIMRTIISREIMEIIVVGGIIAIRIALVFIIGRDRRAEDDELHDKLLDEHAQKPLK